MFTNRESCARSEDIVPHQSLMIIKLIAFKKPHRDENACRKKYGEYQKYHNVAKIHRKSIQYENFQNFLCNLIIISLICSIVCEN